LDARGGARDGDRDLIRCNVSCEGGRADLSELDARGGARDGDRDGDRDLNSCDVCSAPKNCQSSGSIIGKK
jgi:hypothetical protein